MNQLSKNDARLLSGPSVLDDWVVGPWCRYARYHALTPMTYETLSRFFLLLLRLKAGSSLSSCYIVIVEDDAGAAAADDDDDGGDDDEYDGGHKP